MKQLLTLLACAAMTLAANAQNSGDYVYTANGKYKVLTGENLLSNGDFSHDTDDWTTDGGQALSADTFAIEPIEPGGLNTLVVLAKDNGPGTGSSLLRRVAVDAGRSYVASYQVKGNDDAVATTVTTGDNVKNYQNIFFSQDGSLTPDADNGAIATAQTYGWGWTTFSYGYMPVVDGYIVFHFYAPYISTAFTDFRVMEVQQVPDDREAAEVIARLRAYIDNPLFPNAHDILEGVIESIQDFVDADDIDGYNELVMLIDEAVASFLDENTANLSSYVPNLTLDDLKATSANQTSAGAWIIDDGLRAVNPSGKVRWAVKEAAEGDAPLSGLYLQNDIPYGTNNKLYEATVHQTISNMPAGQYMFTAQVRGYKLNNKAGDMNTDIHGLSIFVNNDSTACYPVKPYKAQEYIVYSTLTETGDIKLGYHQDDAVANHVDLDFTSLRLIGWTQEQVDEFFQGKEFAEARQQLKHTIDSARTWHANPDMLYGKPQLDSAIVASQGYYDNIAITDSLVDSNTRLKKEIANYISRNATLTAFRQAIANAEAMMADTSYSDADKQPLAEAIATAKAFLATLSADNHMTEGYTNSDIQEHTRLLNQTVNLLLVTKLVADEKYEFLNWAQQDGAAFDALLADNDDDAITTTSGATVYRETAPFAGHDLNSRLAFRRDVTRTLSTAHGLQVTYTSKNNVTTAILNLHEGDRIVMDWLMGNATHNVMVVSANARVRQADGTWLAYTEKGKVNANVLPKDNTDGLSASVRSTIEMTADGTLDLYQSSSNSTIRIYYLGITNYDPTGIATVQTTVANGREGYYDLRGQHHTALPTQKGIYIHQGKKVVVK